MSDSDELNYFNKNEELAVDIITMLDGIKLRIQNELKLNLQKYTDDFTPLNEVDEAARERQSKDMVEDIATNTTPQSTKREKKIKDLSTAISILSEATMSGYDRIRKSLLRQFEGRMSKEELPSFYILTKK